MSRFRSVRSVMRQAAQQAVRQLAKILARQMRRLALVLWRLSFRGDERLFDTIHEGTDALAAIFACPVNLGEHVQQQHFMNGGAGFQRGHGLNPEFPHFTPSFTLTLDDGIDAGAPDTPPFWESAKLGAWRQDTP